MALGWLWPSAAAVVCCVAICLTVLAYGGKIGRRK
jgi:hypothetical protein